MQLKLVKVWDKSISHLEIKLDVKTTVVKDVFLTQTSNQCRRYFLFFNSMTCNLNNS